MRRLSIGRSLAALAAVGFLTVAPPERFALRAAPPLISNEQRRKRSKNKKGPSPNGLTGQRFDKSRLIVDRASSFKRLRRWARSRPELVEQPSEKALLRHPWYRKKMERAAVSARAA
jgi:hypothetical protein